MQTSVRSSRAFIRAFFGAFVCLFVWLFACLSFACLLVCLLAFCRGHESPLIFVPLLDVLLFLLLLPCAVFFLTLLSHLRWPDHLLAFVCPLPRPVAFFCFVVLYLADCILLFVYQLLIDLSSSLVALSSGLSCLLSFVSLSIFPLMCARVHFLVHISNPKPLLLSVVAFSVAALSRLLYSGVFCSFMCSIDRRSLTDFGCVLQFASLILSSLPGTPRFLVKNRLCFLLFLTIFSV